MCVCWEVGGGLREGEMCEVVVFSLSESPLSLSLTQLIVSLFSECGPGTPGCSQDGFRRFINFKIVYKSYQNSIIK